MIKSFEPIKYNKAFDHILTDFFKVCLPESCRTLDINGRHSYYKDIAKHFKTLRCMFDGENIIGTVAVSEFNYTSCELKSLLPERYHSMGYGKGLLLKAIDYAKEHGYEKMYLDSLPTSKKAITLYRKTGFSDTEKYNSSEHSDIFMVLDLKDKF
ncbi:MAG: GNAT family N-acetyltransferase [Oscillospiraceae bacterium]|nr:GNAT family N-acetyltransferase [Oscillospiraceae bacterium]